MTNNYFLDLKDDQVVLFADIIGFSKIVSISEDINWEDSNSNPLKKSLLSIYDYITGVEFSQKYQELKGIRLLWISDSIIVSCGIENINNLLIVLDELTHLLYCSGFIIRGGISVGKLYHDRNIWGSSYIKAVELEKKAINPRIIISKEDIHKLNIYDRHKRFFNRIGNKYFYYDYFGSYFNEQIRNSIDISDTLIVYSTMIVDNFGLSEEISHIEKWRWLAKELIKIIKIKKVYINGILKSRNVYIEYSQGRISNINDIIRYLEIVLI